MNANNANKGDVGAVRGVPLPEPTHKIIQYPMPHVPGERSTEYFWGYTHEELIAYGQACATPPPDAAQAVAWMHDQPGRVDVIHAEVKNLLVNAHKQGHSPGHMLRPQPKHEHYTIPLYLHPAPVTINDAALRALIAEWRTEADACPVPSNSEDRGCSNAMYRAADELEAALTAAGCAAIPLLFSVAPDGSVTIAECAKCAAQPAAGVPASEVRALYRHCVNIMESARDQIIARGGDCDQVDVMENRDPVLARIRGLLAAAPQPEGTGNPAISRRAELAVAEYDRQRDAGATHEQTIHAVLDIQHPAPAGRGDAPLCCDGECNGNCDGDPVLMAAAEKYRAGKGKGDALHPIQPLALYENRAAPVADAEGVENAERYLWLRKSASISWNCTVEYDCMGGGESERQAMESALDAARLSGAAGEEKA